MTKWVDRAISELHAASKRMAALRNAKATRVSLEASWEHLQWHADASLEAVTNAMSLLEWIHSPDDVTGNHLAEAGLALRVTEEAINSTVLHAWRAIERFQPDRHLVGEYSHVCFADQHLDRAVEVLQNARDALGEAVNNYPLNVRKVPDLLEAVTDVPFLTPSALSDAHRMSELYVVLFCYENSVRCFIEQVFSNKYGDDWWNLIASTSQKNLVESRRQKEHTNRWLSPRGNASSLYYLEWGDLIKLIRKQEFLFVPFIGSLSFVENRFAELEGLRHIVAHHGVLPSDEDFLRAVISFRDWCRQLAPYAANRPSDPTVNSAH